MCLAYPMKIVELKKNTACVVAHGLKKEVNTQLLSDLKKGDFVMVHAGFAIETIKKTEAKKTLKVLREYNHALSKLKANR